MKHLLRYLLLSCALSLAGSHIANADEMMMARINQDFPEAMLRLQELLKNQGYTVSRVQRVDIGLTKSGYKTDKYRVVFYGKPAEIQHISKTYPELTPYLPLKIAMFAEAEDTMLIAANPLILAPKAPEKLKQQLVKWEKDLQALLKAIKQPAD